MTDYTSIKVSEDTARWAVRFKGSLERTAGVQFSLDWTICLALQFADYKYAKEKGLTDQNFLDYILSANNDLNAFAEIDKLKKMMAYHREWYRTHPEKQKIYEKRRNKKHRKMWQDEYRKKNKNRINARSRRWTRKTLKKYRNEVINKLGGECIACGINNRKLLQIHHTKGNGNEIRKKYGNGRPLNDYRYYRDMLNDLNDLELYCANCHILIR